MTAAKNYIWQYVRENGLTKESLERLAGCAPRSVFVPLSRGDLPGPSVWKRLDALIQFTPECWAEWEARQQFKREKMRASRLGDEFSPQPWPLTVEIFKDEKPVWVCKKWVAQ